jgi:DNA polymerase-3 subunit epsilon
MDDNRTWAVYTARTLLKDNPFFLDTETTGLDDYAKICELSIVDVSGNILMDTLISPLDPIPPEATKIHGISNAMVDGAPSFPDVLPRLQAILKGHTVVTYNCSYDFRLLWQSAVAHGINSTGLDYKNFHCAMKLYALFHGEWIEKYLSYKCYKLKRAALDCGIKLPGNLHRARVDAELTRQVTIHVSQSEL